jgi:hypothetical protein
MHTIIHNFHSQVYTTLEEIRASAHFLIRQATGGIPLFKKDIPLPEFIIVAPQESVNTYVSIMTEKIINATDIRYRSFGEAKDRYLKSLKRIHGIKIFESPPTNLLKLIKIVNKINYTILDIDIDYISELQNECYTKMKGLSSNQLGSLDKVLNLIRKSKPQLITVSEVKASAIVNEKSNFSKLIKNLESIGYDVEYKLVYDDDEEPQKILNIYQKFVENIQEPLVNKYVPDIITDDFNKEIKKATKQYFQEHKF